MAGMDLDSPPPVAPGLPPRDRILRALALNEVPKERLDQAQPGLVAFVAENKPLIPKIVLAIVGADAELPKASGNDSIREYFDESLLWLQWLMFEGDPEAKMKDLAGKAAGQRAVCGAVWGQNDLAYHCRTCEHDSTCAICVPCFQNGDHTDHDYSIMYTGGGCCDCGDESAWKREGFCSKHKGSEKIQPIPNDLASSMGPVLDCLFARCWKDRLLLAESRKSAGERSADEECVLIADEFSSSVVEMLLDFCNCSDGLLSFISKRVIECNYLLRILMRAERFLDEEVAGKLRELLMKLLGEPLFKNELAKVFVRYYPCTIADVIREGHDSVLEKYPILSTFSVQIFTVPTLTPRLVREENLLGMLLGCLRDLFLSCAADDGLLQGGKWTHIYETTFRLIEDIRYVMSHKEVPIYIANEQPYLSRCWIWLLSLVQGMDAHKRVTGLIFEEETENLYAMFYLGYYLGNVSNLLADGAFSVAPLCSLDNRGSEDADGQRHAKVGRFSQESSACIVSNKNLDDVSKCGDANSSCTGSSFPIPPSATWLIMECLKAIENSLGPDTTPRINSPSFNASSSSINITPLRKKLLRARKATSIRKVGRMTISSMGIDGLHESANVQMPEMPGSTIHWNASDTAAPYPEDASMHESEDDELLEVGSREFCLLNLTDWPDIVYDVSSQEISFHIPLHRFLSLLFRKAMMNCYGEIGKVETADGISSSRYHEFFVKLLGGLQPCGFSGFIMEQPLHLRVFCAQVYAGMWRKNGDAASLCEHYRSVQWLEQGLESDLFLLQCCAALAPPDSFVQRIQERFGLSSYTQLNLADFNEYESDLVQEMLTLLIQIVQERRFCGLTPVENMRRELVCKLATGDATRSQLMKALPRSLAKSDQFQNILDMLSEYSNPSGLKQGKYSLRKEHWKELDLYHPRWNSKDLQAAQERYLRFCKIPAVNVQLPRWTGIFPPLKKISGVATSKAVLQIIHAVLFYALFTERSSMTRAPDSILIAALHLLSLALDICEKENKIGVSEVCADIGITHVTGPSCAHITQCEENLFPILKYAYEECDAGAGDESVQWKNQSMLSLLVSLTRKFKEENCNYSETRYSNLSSIIESLLKKFAHLSCACLSYLKRIAPDVVCQIPLHSSNASSQNATSVSDIDVRRAKARERQAAIMAKMRAEQSKFIASVMCAGGDETDSSKSKLGLSMEESDCVIEESKPLCSLCHDPDSQSPLCFLILLQKSRLTSLVERGSPSWEDTCRSNMEIHSVGKERLNDSSVTGSSNPVQLDQNAGLEFANDIEPAEIDAFLDLFKEQLPDVGNNSSPTTSNDTGSATLSINLLENDIYRSVKAEVHDNGNHFHALDNECSTSHTMVESSVLEEYVASLSRGPSRQHHHSMYDLLHFSNVSSSSLPTATFDRFGMRDCDGIHLSSCGHAVHRECHDQYLLSLKRRNTRRHGFEAGHIVDPDKGEFLCPVCRRLANSIMPVLPEVSDKILFQQQRSQDCGLPSTSSENDSNISSIVIALSFLQSTSNMVGQDRFLKFFSRKPINTSEPALEPVLRRLSMLIYPHNHANFAASGRLSQSLVLWDTLRYTLASTEIASRGKWKTNTVGSVSCVETLYGELNSSGGFILSLLLHVAQVARSLNSFEVLLRFRGMQLFAGSICSGISLDSNISNIDKRRGIFSFVLERAEKGETYPDIQFWKRTADPILAHDPFSSVMWVLYGLPLPFISSTEFFIPLVQLFYVVSVIQAMITCYNKGCLDISSFGDSLLSIVCKTMSESEFARKYFASNYIDSSCHPKDMVRRLTFPYLRKCALLWKLLHSSSLTPLFGSSNKLYESSHSVDADALDVNDRLMVELNGVRELEDMFQIQSLDLVLKDELVHSIALKWCDHFCKEFKARSFGNILFSTPAVPFKLMQLPWLYQDLLQRYLKQPCPICNTVPGEPALCLLCGKLCSPSWNSCCRENKCHNHAMICGAGIGVFLLVKKTAILLQRSSRQSVWPSPYLDAYGEEDISMRRGKPLHLSQERYTALTHLMASHGFDRSSEVLRQTTITNNGPE